MKYCAMVHKILMEDRSVRSSYYVLPAAPSRYVAVMKAMSKLVSEGANTLVAVSEDGFVTHDCDFEYVVRVAEAVGEDDHFVGYC